MVLDFGFLKEEMMAQIDAPFDHSFIFSVDDELCVDMFGLGGDPEKAAVDCALRESGRYYGQGRGMKISVLPVVPTAENLARFWYEMLAARIVERSDGKASLVCLKVWETPNCWAAYGPLMELGIADG